MAKSNYMVEFAENHNCPEERTSTRIREFLRTTEPLVVDLDRIEHYEAIKAQIEHLAQCCETETDLKWDAHQCANVLGFLHWIKPVEGRCFCNDSSRINATCGYHSLLIFVEDQMRDIGDRQEKFESWSNEIRDIIWEAQSIVNLSAKSLDDADPDGKFHDIWKCLNTASRILNHVNDRIEVEVANTIDPTAEMQVSPY